MTNVFLMGLLGVISARVTIASSEAIAVSHIVIEKRGVLFELSLNLVKSYAGAVS